VPHYILYLLMAFASSQLTATPVSEPLPTQDCVYARLAMATHWQGGRRCRLGRAGGNLQPPCQRAGRVHATAVGAPTHPNPLTSPPAHTFHCGTAGGGDWSTHAALHRMARASP